MSRFRGAVLGRRDRDVRDRQREEIARARLQSPEGCISHPLVERLPALPERTERLEAKRATGRPDAWIYTIRSSLQV